MHQLQVIGDRLLLAGHDGQDREEEFARAVADGRVLSCHGLAESIRGTEPLTRTGRRNAGYVPDHPGAFLSSAQARRAEQVRTVWLAYRWLRAGRTLARVAPLLGLGPGPEKGAAWLDAGVEIADVAAWGRRRELADYQRWRRSPHLSADASMALDAARSSGRWGTAAGLALLGDVLREPPRSYMEADEVEQAVRTMRTDVTGPAGTAGGELHDWLFRGWIRVTTPDDCVTYRATLTLAGARRLAALWVRSWELRSKELPGPAEVREEFREVWQIAELARLLSDAGVYEVSVDDPSSIMVTNEFDGPTNLPDVERFGLQRASGPRQRFHEAQYDLIIQRTAGLVAKYGIPLRVDLRRLDVTGPLGRVATGGRWCDRLPAVVADAITMVEPGMQPASADEFLSWVRGGLPSLETYCGAATHRLRAVGGSIVFADHDSALRDEDEFMAALSGEPIGCYALSDRLSGTEPLGDPADTYRRSSEEPLAAYRTVWLAYRWLAAGWDLHEVAALLGVGPGPERAGSWLAAGVPAGQVVAWQPLHDLDGYRRWSAWPTISAARAATLDRYGIEPADLDAWGRRGVPAALVAGWLDRIRDGSVAEPDVPAWVAAGVSGEDYLRHGLAMPLPRFLKWQATGLPLRHIRVYEDSGLKPKMVRGYGQILGLASDPIRYVIERLGLPPYGPRTRSRVEYNASLLLEYSKDW